MFSSESLVILTLGVPFMIVAGDKLRAFLERDRRHSR